MSFHSNPARRRETGFSLIELMVGMTIGFIAMAVIVQTLSVFEGHKRTTTAGADAQENGLLAMMAIETDIRKAASGFNHPATFSCQNIFSHFQAVSGAGAPTAVGAFSPIPILIEDDVAKAAVTGVVADSVTTDRINVRSGARFTGSVPTLLSETMVISAVTAEQLEFKVDRAFDFVADDLIMVADPDSINCSLMRVTAVVGNQLNVVNGPAGKMNEYNPTRAYMTANNWPGFGSRAGQPYPKDSFVFRVGSNVAGGIQLKSYSVNANNSLQAIIDATGAATSTEVLNSEIVALQAQYGVSASKDVKTIDEWVNASGATWGSAALSASTAAAIANRQRIKAVRVAVVARSSARDGALVTNACEGNNAPAAFNYGPCSWIEDTAANPAPAIDLRTAVGDTEWQHYRYKVYQTVIPMRNVLWPDL